MEVEAEDAAVVLVAAVTDSPDEVCADAPDAEGEEPKET